MYEFLDPRMVRLVGPDEETVWAYEPADGRFALVIGDPSGRAGAVVGTLDEIEDCLNAAYRAVRHARDDRDPLVPLLMDVLAAAERALAGEGSRAEMLAAADRAAEAAVDEVRDLVRERFPTAEAVAFTAGEDDDGWHATVLAVRDGEGRVLWHVAGGVRWSRVDDVAGRLAVFAAQPGGRLVPADEAPPVVLPGGQVYSVSL